jgi:hypothetical protein
MKRTNQSILRTTLAAGLLSAFCLSVNAATTYKIVNNPTVQSGYTLSGTIITDGKTGTIYGSNVLAWSFSASNGANTYSASSSDPGSTVGMGANGIVATADYLVLPSATMSGHHDIALVSGSTHVQWTGSTIQDFAFTSASRDNGVWTWWQDHITTTPHDVPGGWAIADGGTPVPQVPTTYKIVNNPTVQSGYTLSGTITTDGKTGTIYGSNVLAWSFSASNGANTYSASSSDPGSTVGMGANGIVATADYLVLPSATMSGHHDIALVSGSTHVQWTGSTIQDFAFTSASRGNGVWTWWQDHITTTPHDVPGGWAIADGGTPVPRLNLRKAVYVESSSLKVGANYQFQVSTGLNRWTNFGSAFTATNSTWRSSNYWDVDGWNQLFFRLQVAP